MNERHDLITIDENEMYHGLLTCGHYSDGFHQASSQWDFPHEVLTCPVCGEERQFDLALQAEMTRGMCEWFATCDNYADGIVKHPVLGDVPTCKRCADKLNLDLEER